MRRERIALDPARIRDLFDLRRNATLAGGYEDDPYPAWHQLRERGPLQEGTPGRLMKFEGPELFFGLPEPERRHFTAFDFATCDAIVRNSEAFRMSPPDPGERAAVYQMSMLTMDGPRHRRYRELVQPCFNPERMPWWTENWARPTIEALIDSFESNRRADLNVEFCAAIPLLTICGSFGISVDAALDIRTAVRGGAQGAGAGRMAEILRPILAARRAEPRDDLISVLVGAELTDAEGETHVLSDVDILSFSWLLLAAGSGTTWKQMGITLVAMLERPEWIEAARADHSVLEAIVEESVRWMPTDPVFARFAHEDVELEGVIVPKGAVAHVCYGAASRDPARWDRPDEFDPRRPPRTHLGFGRGAHVCLGKNLARTEIITAIAALLDRLPGLRLDPDAERPRIIGLYERGATAVPVVWDRALR
ncbi:MAG TPA: cytochrome P450 [Myxococcota bacterium]|nr:cytochrome P450 [Myxococcota bacterium]